LKVNLSATVNPCCSDQFYVVAMASNLGGNASNTNENLQTSAEQPTETSAGQSQNATCYNCGAGDHYLMACPEPTRQVPA